VERIEDAIGEVQKALALMHDATRDHAVDAIDAEVERAISLSRFEVPGDGDDPFHDVDFLGGWPRWPEGPMFVSFPPNSRPASRLGPRSQCC
jgi:hypothetical protein